MEENGIQKILVMGSVAHIWGYVAIVRVDVIQTHGHHVQINIGMILQIVLFVGVPQTKIVILIGFVVMESVLSVLAVMGSVALIVAQSVVPILNVQQ